MLQHALTQAHINQVGEELEIAAAILPTAVGSSSLKVRVPARCLHFVILRDVIKQKIKLKKPILLTGSFQLNTERPLTMHDSITRQSVTPDLNTLNFVQLTSMSAIVPFLKF